MNGRWFALLLCLALAAGSFFSIPSPALAQDPSCVHCHADLGGALGQPVSDWRRSIHAANRVFCFNCHGGDPADYTMLSMSPEKGFIGIPAEEDIPSICGRCHAGVTEDYFRSVHGQTLGEGVPHCATCHGHHAVQRSTPDLINPQLCSRCHEYGRADEIRQAVLETDRRIASLEDRLRSYHLLGIHTEQMASQLFDARHRFHRLFHSVDVDRVRAETAEIQADLQLVRSQVEEIRETLQRRRIGGGVVVALLVVMGIVATLLRKTYQAEEGSKE
jgi:hypothetical protein